MKATKKKPTRPKNGGGKKGGEAMVSFTPDRTLPLTVNGRTIEVHAGSKATVPVSFKAVYDAAN